MRQLLFALLLAALGGCPAESTGGDAGTESPDAGAPDGGSAQCPAGQRRADEQGSCVAVGWTQCAEGFAADSSGWGCVPVMPEAACPAGTFARLGETGCQAVGVGACPEGFAADESGFGCAPVLPAAACSGATREALGRADCAPLGDCAAAFPPAEATLFVDDGYSASQLDATHFATVAAAVAAAADGATIAIEEGRYVEPLVLTRPVKLVGRCAEKVVLAGTLNGKSGIDARADAEISGVTITGFDLGIVAEYGPAVEVRDSLLEGNRKGGAAAYDPGTVLTFRRSAVRGTLAGTDQKYGDGAVVMYGATLALEDCAVVGNRTAGLFAQTDGSRLTVARSVVSGTLPNGLGFFGYGIQALESSEVVLEGSAIVGGSIAGLGVFDSTATVKSTTISGTKVGSDSAGQKMGGAVVAQTGVLSMETSTLSASEATGLLLSFESQATVTGSVIRGVRAAASGEPGMALEVEDTSTLSASGLALLDNHGVALTVHDQGRVTLSDSLIRGTEAVDGIAVTGAGITALLGGSLTATRVTLSDNAGAALSVDQGASATVEALIVSDTRSALVGQTAQARYGLGIRLVNGALTLKRSLLERNAAAGMLLSGQGTQAQVSDSLVRETSLSEAGAYGFGIAVQDGAALVLERSGVVGNRSSGLWASTGGTIAATGGLVSGTLADGSGRHGQGLVARDGAKAVLTGMAVFGNASAGLVGIDGATLEVTGSLVRGAGLEVEREFGEGVALGTGAVGWLRDSTIEENQDVGLLVFDAAAGVAGCQIDRNGAGVDVAGQSTLSEKAELPQTLAAGEVVVTSDTAFLENTVRIGSGTVAMPPTPSSL